ncbi:MAG: 1-(5-phosphoribosyl)-5-[Clostridia bacterium]|nr:1-(5-phosphoribosyl)-5-[(5-phosphoribosylamino)methylideneamino]imidazole-4-carboxamide isomerase [Clostridia bacterium]
MNIIPAIDLIGGKAVRLKKGDYNEVTVYSNKPSEVAKSFEKSGASFMHIVDLDGAKDGSTANFDTIKAIVSDTSLSVEVGGGIRNMDTVRKYMEIGVDRVIIGTAAVRDPEFLAEAVKAYPENIAVGIDVKDGAVAIKGWTELSEFSCLDFCRKMQTFGVKTIICTDISKDGMMSGTNLELYSELQEKFDMNIIASGGVSSLDDIRKLSKMKVWGAILGKALYTGAVSLDEALAAAKEAE